MERSEESHQPIRPSRERLPEPPPQDEQHCDAHDLPPWPVSPPPMPWPRVFPSL